jgi:23S rRNA (pseudouridine1915-N3)-methyltransferase
MKVTLLVVGKTDERFMKEGIDHYVSRLKHYVDFKIEIIPDIKKTKNTSPEVQKRIEGERILSKWSPAKEFYLFDEKGISYSSRGFAVFFEKKMLSGLKELVLVIGGPYGFSEKVHEKAVSNISLSRMTFSHQLARLLCVEQIYRAFTILKGESYHHD